MLFVTLSEAIGGWIVTHGIAGGDVPTTDEIFPALDMALTRIASLSAEHEARNLAAVSAERQAQIDAALKRGGHGQNARD
jgi:hypothetical protein